MDQWRAKQIESEDGSMAITDTQQQPPDEELEEIAFPPFVIPEDSQPIYAQAENMSSVHAHFLDNLPSGRFTWTINDFSRLPEKVYSSSFFVGGHKWRILLFPKGNNVDYLSMYLDVTDSETMPHGWSRPAHFSLAVVNQVNNNYTIRKDIALVDEEVRPQWRGQKVGGCKSKEESDMRMESEHDPVVEMLEAELIVEKIKVEDKGGMQQWFMWL
ncbi:TRAF-like [Sesbania bispinosa]|nr:TRAF-like [Sesbania bispinosa]